MVSNTSSNCNEDILYTVDKLMAIKRRHTGHRMIINFDSSFTLKFDIHSPNQQYAVNGFTIVFYRKLWLFTA